MTTPYNISTFYIKLTFAAYLQAAVAELVRPYVQKGHNHHACHRFLKNSAEDGDLCVSTPGQRVSYRQFSTPVLQAGEWCAVLESPLNEDTPCTAVKSRRDAFRTYLRQFRPSCDSNLSLFDSMVLA